jgi:ADP-ribosylarginine hydrolase
MSSKINSPDIHDRLKWIMLLHALGDTIGFKNGDWEFNYYKKENLINPDFSNELIYEFIHLGGVNGINLKEWRVSDDTIFHIAIAKAMIKYKGEITRKFTIFLKYEMTMALHEMINDEKKKDDIEKINRLYGNTTASSVRNFNDDYDARNDQYNNNGGGNGAAMRNLVIGFCLSGEKNRDQLIDCSIITSQFTHNNPLGYLGGFTSALFTALAIEKVNIIK